MGPPDPRESRAALAALVFAGGDPPGPEGLGRAAGADLVIAADSGLAHARALGCARRPRDRRPRLRRPDRRSTPRWPTARSWNDTPPPRTPPTSSSRSTPPSTAARPRCTWSGSAAAASTTSSPTCSCSGHPATPTARVDAHVGGAHVTVVHDRVDLVGAPGRLCSLLPFGGPAVGVLTDGLRYPLRRETLAPGTTRGVSNEFARRPAPPSRSSRACCSPCIPTLGTTDLERDV